MDDSHILISTRDTLLAAIPFAVLFFFSIFRLDQILAAPRAAGGSLPQPSASMNGESPFFAIPTADW